MAPGALPTQVVPSGTPLGYASKWKGSLSADYRARNLGPVDLFLGASISAQSQQLSQFSPDPVVRQIATINGYSIANLSLGFGGHMDEWRVTLLAAAASSTIELLQAAVLARVGTWTDVAANTVGALLGALAGALLSRRRGRDRPPSAPRADG